MTVNTAVAMVVTEATLALAEWSLPVAVQAVWLFNMMEPVLPVKQ